MNADSSGLNQSSANQSGAAGGLLGRLSRWVAGRDAQHERADSLANQPVAIGVFGKHRAWADFMPDIGLAHPGLAAFKTRLFDTAISPLVQAGTWDEWSEEDRTFDFDHLVLFRPAGRRGDDGVTAPQGWLCGRVAPGEDGRGRRRYPLVAVAFVPPVAGVDESACIGWCCDRVLPSLRHVGGRIDALTSPQEVESAVSAASARLAEVSTQEQQAYAAAGRTMGGEVALAALNAMLGDVEVDYRHRPAMLSVLYELGGRLNEFSRSAPALRVPPPAQAAHMRLPACDSNPIVSLRLWAWFLTTELRGDTPMLLATPADSETQEGGGWVDLVLGPAEPSTMIWLRATPARIAPTTQIPFRLDASFLHRAGGRLAALQPSPSLTQNRLRH